MAEARDPGPQDVPPEALNDAGVRALREGDLVAARAAFTRAISARPGVAGLHYNLGLAWQQGGRAGEALACYDDALRIDPCHVLTWKNRSLALLALGRTDEALLASQRACELAPETPRVLVARANVLRQAGRVEEAAAVYRHALAFDATDIEALVNLGATLRLLKRPGEALTPLRQALLLQPFEPAASVGLGLALGEAGQPEAGLAAVEGSLEHHPDRVDLLLACGQLLHGLRQLDRAEACLGRALELRPHDAQALCNRGYVRADRHRLPEALADLDAALALDPGLAHAHVNRGLVRMAMKDSRRALEDFDRAITLDERLHVAHANRGTLLDALGLADAAIASLRRAVELAPSFGEARWNLAAALLAGGRLEEGWTHFEARWERKRLDSEPLHTSRPRWQPGLPAQHVLVWAEQGIGDQILTLSLISEFARRVPRLTVSVDARLLPLLRRSLQGVSFIDRKSPPPEEAYDSHLPMGSLPRYLRPTLADFAHAPRRFLEPDPARRQTFGGLRTAHGQWRCALSWRSNRLAIGADKSLSLEQLLPVLRVPGVDFIDLQYGDNTAERQQLTEAHGIELLEHDGLDKTLDLDGLAAAVDACEVVVTTSNSTAHLAGALGKPTLLLLPRGSGRLWYWRMSHEGRSLWYPSVLLLEQDEPGQWERAIHAARDRLSKWRAQAWAAKAENCLKRGHVKSAEAMLAQAVSLCPDVPAHRFSWANSLRRLGANARAIQEFDEVIRQAPRLAEAHNNRANLLQDLGRLEEAVDGYDHAVLASPGYASAFINRGVALNRLGRPAQALASFESALQVDPALVSAHISRGDTLDKLGRTCEALASLDEALRLDPESAHAWVSRGRLLAAQERFAQAAQSYEHALAHGAQQRFLFGQYLHMCMKSCNWDRMPDLLQAARAHIERGDPQVPPFVVMGTLDDPALQRRAAKVYSHTKCPPNDVLGPIGPRSPGKKLHIGYFSPDFRHHPVALLTVGLFEHHDRDRFEVTAFWWGPAEGGELRQRIAARCDRMVDVRGMSDVEVAALARRLGIDIAIDLTGHTDNTRPGIFACRAAPLQASYIGYLGTMGSPCYDYLFADRHTIPAELQAHYTEKIVYLPHYQANDGNRRRPGQPGQRTRLGLPPDAFVFANLNNTYKITPAIFDAWMRVLQRVPQGVLYLYAEGEQAVTRLRARAASLGVDPGRLHTGGRVPFGEYLARYEAMDLFLDTLPYNAGTTASDALWMGLPVLTCMGQAFAARMGGSVLHAMGLPELVTTRLEDYEEMAVRLASDPVLLEQVKTRVQQQRSTCALFDPRRFTRGFETALLAMAERQARGLAPEHIDVGEGPPRRLA